MPVSSLLKQDPATVVQQNLLGETAQGLGKELNSAELRLVSCSEKEIFYHKETQYLEWMKLSKGELNVYLCSGQSLKGSFETFYRH